MRFGFLTLLAVLTSSSAFALCPVVRDTIFSCTFQNGATSVEICLDYDEVTYTYGPTGGPAELYLSQSLARIDYYPWPGASATIWEEVVFYNGDVAYAVHGATERIFTEDETADAIIIETGGITVTEADQTLAILECDAESVGHAFGVTLYDAKTAIGQCWQDGFWQACQ